MNVQEELNALRAAAREAGIRRLAANLGEFMISQKVDEPVLKAADLIRITEESIKQKES